MKNSNGNALIAGILVVGCMLVVGGLVAWGSGAFAAGDSGATSPTSNGNGTTMDLPEGHPPIGNMTRSPGPVRSDAPAGACPVTMPKAGAAAAADDCSCCPSEAAVAAAASVAGDSCCPEPQAKKEACAGDGNCEDGPCEDGPCEDGGCEKACEKPAEN